jgi:hypothetical protein
VTGPLNAQKAIDCARVAAEALELAMARDNDTAGLTWTAFDHLLEAHKVLRREIRRLKLRRTP